MVEGLEMASRTSSRTTAARGCACVCVCGLLSAWDEVGVSMVTLDVGSVRGTTIQDGEWRVVIVSGTGMGGWNPLGEVEPKVLNDKFSR